MKKPDRANPSSKELKVPSKAYGYINITQFDIIELNNLRSLSTLKPDRSYKILITMSVRLNSNFYLNPSLVHWEPSG